MILREYKSVIGLTVALLRSPLVTFINFKVFSMSSRLALGLVRFLAVAAALSLFATTESSRVAMHAQSSCGASINPIACENAKPGNLASEWDVSGSGDASIQGFATNISVVPGETVQFKIDTPSSNYRLDIYRMGFYGGMGARKVSDPAGILPSAALPQVQPHCLTDSLRPHRLRQLGRVRVVGRAGRRGVGHLLRQAAPHRHRRREPHLLHRA